MFVNIGSNGKLGPISGCHYTKTWDFEQVTKINIDVETNTCTIGYHDDDGSYHEETNDVPDWISIDMKRNSITPRGIYPYGRNYKGE